MKTRILMIRWGGLGDLLVALPAIRLVRLAFPSASLTLAGRPAYASVLRDAGVVDDIMDVGGIEAMRLFSSLEDWSAAGPGAGGRTGFDLVVGWLNRRESVFQRARGPEEARDRRMKLIAYDAGGAAAINRFFYDKTLEALGLMAPRPASFEELARLPLDSLRSGAETLLPSSGRSRKYVVIHPGSGGEAKRWPLENFFEIARRLEERGWGGAFVTGDAEAPLEPKIEAAARPQGWAWLRSPALARLAILLEGADLYIGNDSGITHLAACCGARVVALFRDDLVGVWRPAGRVQVLSGGSITEIPVDALWAAAAQMLCI